MLVMMEMGMSEGRIYVRELFLAILTMNRNNLTSLRDSVVIEMHGSRST